MLHYIPCNFSDYTHIHTHTKAEFLSLEKTNNKDRKGVQKQDLVFE